MHHPQRVHGSAGAGIALSVIWIVQSNAPTKEAGSARQSRSGGPARSVVAASATPQEIIGLPRNVPAFDSRLGGLSGSDPRGRDVAMSDLCPQLSRYGVLRALARPTSRLRAHYFNASRESAYSALSSLRRGRSGTPSKLSARRDNSCTRPFRWRPLAPALPGPPPARGR